MSQKENILISGNDKKINMIDAFKKFLECTDPNIKDLFIKNERYIYFLYAYAENTMKLYMNNYNRKAYIIPRRNILYIKKLFIKNNIGDYKYKNEELYNVHKEKIFMFMIIYSFIIFLEVLKCKSKINNKVIENNNKKLKLLNYLLFIFIHIVGNFYSSKIIDEKHLETIFKFLIILSTSISSSKPANKNDNIVNIMFLVQCVKAMKILFNKIYLTKNEFNEKQEQLMNNIIIFLKDYLIEYVDQKPINAINKFFLSNNDYYTTSLIEISPILSKMKNREIKANYIELITNIYNFSFRNENLMSQLLKLIEPILLNLDKKMVKEINSELDLIHLILNFMKVLFKKENQILEKEPLLKDGFFLGNKICGITSEIDVLEDDFSLIFGFCLSEKYNPNNEIKEWTLISIKNKENKDKVKLPQIKIWLSKLDNSINEYNLMISDKNQVYNTNVIIKSKSSYIFSFNFVKNKKIKISYICDNSSEIKKIKDINLKCNLDNTHIYIGCDIRKKSMLEEEQQNTFVGYIGTIIILNNKKLAKKGDENIDLILQLKGDYAKCIVLTLGERDSKCENINLINNEEKFQFINNENNMNILNRLDKIYKDLKMNFLDVIKTVISPYSFKLVKYHDEIDYLKIYNDYKIYEEESNDTSYIEARQNYLNLEQKASSSKNWKMVKIFSRYFNSRFNIFANKNSLEEFIKYDGIIYLCLLLEYDYQILCNIQKNNTIGKKIFEKIEHNIIEVIKFFMDYIINKDNIRNFNKEFEKFFYQMTTTIKMYININKINDNIIGLISQLIDKITDLIKVDNADIDEDLKNKIKSLKSKLLGLLHDILILFFPIPELNYYVISNYIKIFSNLLTKGKLNDLFKNELIDEFLSLSLIFEHKISLFNNENDKYYLQKLYEDFLINLLKNTTILNQQKSNNNNLPKIKEQKSNILIGKKKSKIAKEKQKEEKIELKNEYLNHYIEISLQKENFPDVFSSLLIIVYKSGLIREIDTKYIYHIKSILKKNYNVKEKKALCNSCLKILLIYSLSNEEEEKKLHNFLKKLEFYEGFFYSVITTIKYIKFMGEDDKSNKNNIESNSPLNNNENDKNEIYPLLDLDLNNLNKKQNNTLIKLLQDCISMLFEFNQEKKIIAIRKNLNSEIAKDIYDCLKVNINEAFKCQGQNVFKDIFSSESNIISKLFFFRWKLSNKDEKKEILEDFKFYHKKLLKNHRFPFVFDFISLILSDENYDEKDFRKIDLIMDILDFIINEFESYYNKSNKKVNKEDIYLIINIINYVILINKIYFQDENFVILINITKFKELFFRLIDILDITGLLFSNYCFEVEDNIGKLICEICYDIFLSILDRNFNDENKQKFISTFLIYDKQKKTFYSIFYLMDLNREEILKKEKQIRKDYLIRYIDNYSNLKFIQDTFFNSNIKVYGKNINKIEDINFSIYFLAKTFLHHKEKENEELKKILIKNILPILSKYLYFIWTKHIAFYGHKICSKFLLYKATKDFFESHLIQEENSFDKLKDFFAKDIAFKLNGQDNISSCYASRLLDRNLDSNNETKKKEDDDDSSKDNLTVIPNNSLNIPEDNKCFDTFDKVINGNVLINPKNYLMKIVFSDSFKNVLFKDEVFQKVKHSFVSKYRDNIGLDFRTKQLEYPSTEKNFSNFLEPKTFLRRDYNFYKNDFFPVTHEYIKKNLINERDDNKLFFYKHSFQRDLNNEKDFDCELITNQLLYFGKFIMHKKYIYFKSEDDPRDKNPKGKENIYSKLIFSVRNNDNKTEKSKDILILVKEIKEVIQKRTLLMYNSLEIFNKNGKSFFFNFFTTKECGNICLFFKNECQINVDEGKESIKNYISLYKKGDLSNYEYLLYLNKLSTRTFNDWSQYPIFPWITRNIAKIVEGDIIKDSSEKDEIEEEDDSEMRDMNYPISMQSKNNRLSEIGKFQDDAKITRHPSHLGTHYSTSSYIFYYLMRNNPACKNMIKLQNYKQENPNRTFLSFTETQKILKSISDNRELIPDLFCYIDYFCNVNCAFFGQRNKSILVDDFRISEEYNKDNEIYFNLISKYVKYLYVHKKLLNDYKTSKELSNWVDIIFGKRQYPKNAEERSKSCNIYAKLTYEDNINLEEKLNKYISRFEEDKNLEKQLIKKLFNKINIISNFGVCPRQILKESVVYEINPSLNIQSKKLEKSLPSDFYYYFTKKNDKYYSIYEISKESIKKVQVRDNIESKETNKNSTLYICRNFEIMMTNNYDEIQKISYLYKPNYSICLLTLNNKLNQPENFLLTCRYLGNYFKVQNNDKEKEIKIFCEDFITTIVSRYSDKYDPKFFTGLKNGKLIKWEIEIIKKENSGKKNKREYSSSFRVNELAHIYDHKSSITAIEINNKKQIIATSSEDKFIHIRKLYDFELLTVIDLSYSYGNPIISQNEFIFPSLLKISDLNCIYVLFYDYKSKKTFIRGYTLNGLFFAQTTNEENIYYNNIVINKEGNLFVGAYNKDIIYKLNSFDLKINEQELIQKSNDGNKWLEIDYSNNAFIILYDRECRFIPISDKFSEYSIETPTKL